MVDVMDMLSSKEDFCKAYEKFCDSSNKVYIYGSGKGCAAIFEFLMSLYPAWKNANIVGIIDNYEKGKKFGLPIYTFSEFLQIVDKDTVVCNSLGFPLGREIYEQCTEERLAVFNVFDTERWYAQYFELIHELGIKTQDEIFVQAGCYDGNVQDSYINWFGNEYKKMIAFEPDTKCYNRCVERFHNNERIDVINAGLSAKSGNGILQLGEVNRSSVMVDSGFQMIGEITGMEDVQLLSLDDYMSDSNDKVTMIALDIEGSEYDALMGGRKIIERDKPKLAISIYHKREDLYQLPLFIHEIRPDYTFYLRHYQLTMGETVLYAL